MHDRYGEQEEKGLFNQSQLVSRTLLNNCCHLLRFSWYNKKALVKKIKVFFSFSNFITQIKMEMKRVKKQLWNNIIVLLKLMCVLALLSLFFLI